MIRVPVDTKHRNSGYTGHRRDSNSPGCFKTLVDQTLTSRIDGSGPAWPTFRDHKVNSEYYLPIDYVNSHSKGYKSFPQKLWISMWIKSSKRPIMLIISAFLLNWLFSAQSFYILYLQ